MKKFTDYKILDQKVSQLAMGVEANILSYLTPTNVETEKKKFFEELDKNNIYNPEFVYTSRNPLFSYFSISPTFKTYKKELFHLLHDIPKDTLGIIFERKILDLFDRMELIKSVGTPNFSENSKEYYGKLNKETISFAKEVISKKISQNEKKISFQTAKKSIEEFIKLKKLPYKVVQRDFGGSKFSINIRTKELFINKGARLTGETVKRLIAHELESHAYRYENGLLQPYRLFARGLSKETLETDEGLAATVEEKKGLNFEEQLKNYAGRVIAVKLARKKSFYETFEELTTFFSDEEAWNITLRAKRGLTKTELPGAFAKDTLYLKGYLKVKKFIEKGNTIESLYYGKYSIYDQPLLEDIDGLVKPKWLPDFR
ncbi:MAG: DUF1704 domain-containing protein [Candidatus ainarchaeum sp.]|nr:DUF1704 domain-containing protein [Candidatus ainarchaeum sp.]